MNSDCSHPSHSHHPDNQSASSESSPICASYGGSGSNSLEGKVLMCFDGVTYCIDVDDIDKKLACGYSLGPCDAPQAEACNNSTAAAEPVSCVCAGKIESITIRFLLHLSLARMFTLRKTATSYWLR